MSMVAPGGAAVGMATSFAMLKAWGFKRPPVGLAVVVTSVWNQLIILGIPIIALAGVAAEGGSNRTLELVAVIALAVFIAIVVGFAIGLSSARLARRVGDRAARIVSWAKGLIGKAPVKWRGESFVRFRDETIGLIRERWWFLTLATLAGHLTVFIVLFVSVRAVGTPRAEVTIIEAFAAWALAACSGRSRSRRAASASSSSASPACSSHSGQQRRGRRGHADLPLPHRRARRSASACWPPRRGRSGIGRRVSNPRRTVWRNVGRHSVVPSSPAVEHGHHGGVRVLFAVPLALVAIRVRLVDQAAARRRCAPSRRPRVARGLPSAALGAAAADVTHWGFDQHGHRGQLVVNGARAALAKVFRRLYALRFPIHHMSLATVRAAECAAARRDITGSFECRQAVPSPCTGGDGTGHWSMHAYGEAIDLNPVENPYVGCGMTRDKPRSRTSTGHACGRGMVTPAVVAAFASIGWGWGGAWTGSTKDYMHFSSTGH